jgi:pimeloyl-ACP methyl ester carboxylesterase
MFVEEAGEGAPLLFLHGATEYIGYSGELVRRLASSYRVVQPEQQGHGRTPDRPGPLHYDDMTADTIALIETMGLGRPHVVGFSDGGILGIQMAMQRPDLIDRVVAIGANVSVSGLTDESREWLATVTPETWYPDFAAKYRELSPDGPDHWPVIVRKARDMLANEPEIPPEQLARIQSPVLIMGGDHDMITLEHFVAMHRAIARSQLCIVPGASHELTTEAPDLVAEVILRFLAAK